MRHRLALAAFALACLSPTAAGQGLPQAVEVTVEFEVRPVQVAPLPAGRGIRLGIAMERLLEAGELPAGRGIRMAIEQVRPPAVPPPPALALGTSSRVQLMLTTPPGATAPPAPALNLGASESVRISLSTPQAAAVPTPPALSLGASSSVVIRLTQEVAPVPVPKPVASFVQSEPASVTALQPSSEYAVQIVQVIPRRGANFFDRNDPTGNRTASITAPVASIAAPVASTSVCGAGATVGSLVFVSGTGVITEFDPGGIPRIGFTPVGTNQVGRAFNGVSLAPLTIAAGTSQALSISSAPVGITRFRVGRDGANVCVRVTCHSPILTGCPV